MLKEDVAEEMEKLRIHADEIAEFRSMFRDQDADMHRHP
jgi:hypothetical protein